MNIHIVQILSRISQKDLDLFRPQDLAQGLSSHGAKHIVDSRLEVQSDETKLLVLPRVSLFRSTGWGVYLCPSSDRNFEDFTGYVGEARFFKRFP